jgi:hypothetical protein
MSRRSFPPIAPSDLRDHADEARVARVWERLEREVAVPQREPHRRVGGWALALAASLAAFGGGLVIGRGGDPTRDTAVLPVAPSDAMLMDVLAAGTQGRTYPLPEGGWLTLSPGTLVELERGLGSAYTLRLVQGEATLSTATESSSPVALVAGEARLSAQAGTAVSVRRSDDVVDVRVSNGAVDLESPAGSRRLAQGAIEAVPLRAPVLAVAPATTSPRVAPGPFVRAPKEAHDPSATPVAANDWRSRYAANAWTEAYDALRSQAGGVNGAIDGAATAGDLIAISDVARSGGDTAGSLRALTEASERFPGDPYAQVANSTLGNHYEVSGQGALAQKYRARAASASGVLAEDALCKLLQSEDARGNKEEAARLAREYGAKYPDGFCKDAAGRIARGEPASDDDPTPDQAPPPKDAAP